MVAHERECKRCEKPLNGHRNLKYCPDCAQEVHRIQARECSRRYRAHISRGEPMDWLGELSEAEKTIPVRMQRIYGEHFVQIANEKIRQVERLVEAGLT